MGFSTLVACGCGGECRVIKNGVAWLKRFEDGRPYQLYSADLVECVNCNHAILSINPNYFAHCAQPNFTTQLKELKLAGLLY